MGADALGAVRGYWLGPYRLMLLRFDQPDSTHDEARRQLRGGATAPFGVVCGEQVSNGSSESPGVSAPAAGVYLTGAFAQLVAAQHHDDPDRCRLRRRRLVERVGALGAAHGRTICGLIELNRRHSVRGRGQSSPHRRGHQLVLCADAGRSADDSCRGSRRKLIVAERCTRPSVRRRDRSGRLVARCRR